MKKKEKKSPQNAGEKIDNAQRAKLKIIKNNNRLCTLFV